MKPHNSSPGELSNYMPQLDGLRALAVITVMIQHWGGSHISLFTINIGGYGVGLFFVLSGFLITRILLSIGYGTNCDPKQALRSFWIRRSLRIFPLYYAVLLCGCLVGLEGFREYWAWHLFYLTNFRFNTGDLAYSTHFWTLSVEEQFYLIWPFVVILCNRKIVYRTVYAMVFIAICWRILPSADLRSIMQTSLLPGQVDYLGFGALLALVVRDREKQYQIRFAWTLILLGCVGFVILLCVQGRLQWLNHTCLAMVCCGIVYFASVGFRGWCGRVLQLSPLIRMGRISYGIYVIHMLAPAIWDWFFWSCPIPAYRVFLRIGLAPDVYESHWFRVAVWFVITLVLSSLSWFFLESRIVALKKFFDYAPMRKEHSVLKGP